MKQLEKAVSGKEPRYVLRALRALPSTSRRLNSNVLHKAINGFFTSNSAMRDFLLGFLEEVRRQGMGRDDTSAAPRGLWSAAVQGGRALGTARAWGCLGQAARLLGSAREMRWVAAALGRDGTVAPAAWAGSLVTPQAELSLGWGRASLQAEA